MCPGEFPLNRTAIRRMGGYLPITLLAIGTSWMVIGCGGATAPPKPTHAWQATDMPIEHWVQLYPGYPDTKLAIVTPAVINEVNAVIARDQVLPRWDYVEDTTGIHGFPEARVKFSLGQLAALYDSLKSNDEYPYFLGVVRGYADPSPGGANTPGVTLNTIGFLPGQIPDDRITFMFYDELDVNVQFASANPDYKWLYGAVAHELGHQRAALRHRDEDGNWIYHTLSGEGGLCLMQSTPSAPVMERRRFCIPSSQIPGDSSCWMYLLRTSEL